MSTLSPGARIPTWHAHASPLKPGERVIVVPPTNGPHHYGTVVETPVKSRALVVVGDLVRPDDDLPIRAPAAVLFDQIKVVLAVETSRGANRAP